MLHLILVLLALLLFLLAALGVGASRFNLLAAGLLCWLLASSLGMFNQ